MDRRTAQKTPIPPRATAGYGGRTRSFETDTPHEIPAVRNRQSHWLTPLGCGAVLVLGAVIVWTYIIVPTYQNLSDHWNYGISHVSEADATINGQNERFIAFDDKGHITIIEIPDAHPEKSHIYQAAHMVGDENGNRIITLSFKDMNNDGKTDIVVSIEGETGYVVLFQNAKGFSWQS